MRSVKACLCLGRKWFSPAHLFPHAHVFPHACLRACSLCCLSVSLHGTWELPGIGLRVDLNFGVRGVYVSKHWSLLIQMLFQFRSLHRDPCCHVCMLLSSASACALLGFECSALHDKHPFLPSAAPLTRFHAVNEVIVLLLCPR